MGNLDLDDLGCQHSSDEMSDTSEHVKGMHYNEYIRRYEFNVMALTWKRESYGLYDYEMKEPYKQEFKFDTSK